MTSEQLYENLSYVNHSLEKRLYYASLIENRPELILKLLEIVFDVDDEMSSRAAWIFEFMCSRKIDLIIPHLNYFTENMHKVYLDPAVRPVAKICELITKAYYSKTESEIKSAITNLHKERIIELCFDYLISDHKVAPKAYGMISLFLLGYEYDWVHPELLIILQRDFQKQSAAYKARARHIIKKLKA